MTDVMQRWTGLGGADPDLGRALDLEELVRAGDAWDAAQAALPDEDWWQRGFPPGLVLPLAVGAIGLGVLLLLPAPGGGRRR